MKKAKAPSAPKGLLEELRTYNLKLFEGLSQEDNNLIKDMMAGQQDKGKITVDAEVIMQMAMVLIDIEKKLKELQSAQPQTDQQENKPD